MAGDATTRGSAEAEDISAQLRRGVLHQKWRKKIIHWINYLRLDLKRDNFTEDEDELIIKLHSLLGNKWLLIAGRLPGRTDNEIKKLWNTHIRRKLLTRGIDPATHRQVTEGSFSKEEVRKDEKRPVLERCPDLNLDLRISPPHQHQQNQEGFKTGGRESCTLCFAFILGIQNSKDCSCSNDVGGNSRNSGLVDTSILKRRSDTVLVGIFSGIALRYCTMFALGHIVVAYRTSCKARRKIMLHRIDPEAVLSCKMVFSSYQKVPRSPTPAAGKSFRNYGETRRKTAGLVF
ncbi:hypothetical protein ACS0TY_014620 [Phlomoides rotata]